jgi:hypothetical protein
MTNSSEKGNSLEAAVAAIERQILTTEPGLRENTFVIESKKIINVGGVHHEIDIFVSIDSAPGYKSIFIFECKNLVEAVGKNDLVIFSEKIDAAQAQHGYFVAKSFTKDALAQASKDPRITILIATEQDPTTVPVPLHLHWIDSKLHAVAAVFIGWNSRGTEEIPLDMVSATFQTSGGLSNVKEYLMEWAEEASKQDLNRFRSERVSDGTYLRRTEASREFEHGAVLLDGIVIKRANLTVDYNVRVLHLVVMSSFEVQRRGRVVSFAPVPIEGTTVTISIVQRALS